MGGAHRCAAPPVADFGRSRHDGLGVPAAIGAALAEPQRTVVCFYRRDGSIPMNIQELVTAAEKVNLKIVLMDNATSAWCTSSRPCSMAAMLFASQSQGVAGFIKVAPGLRHLLPSISITPQSVCCPDEAISRPALPDPASIDAEKVYPIGAASAANRDT